MHRKQTDTEKHDCCESSRAPDVPARVEQAKPAGDVRDEIIRGLLYVHSRLNANTAEALEALSVIGALVDLLCRKGLLSAEELEASRRVVEQSLAEQFNEKGLGVLLQEHEEDKYAFQKEVVIDCASRLPLCRAACCRLSFALSKQDVREGIVRWNLEKPYVIAKREDGSCTHLDQTAKSCTVWKNRPVPCRAFDCRRDNRIWVDFEKRIPHPDIERSDWPHSIPHDHEHEKEGNEAKPHRCAVISMQRGEGVIPL